MTENPALLNRLFAKPKLSEVDDELLTGMIQQYPYFAHARWLWAAKKSSGMSAPDALHQAAAFAYHPLRLESYLASQENGTALPQELQTNSGVPASAAKTGTRETPPVENTAARLIQPLFTEDYFAYTGTKLPEHLQNDKKPTMEQLHSFTDWLRTMKRPKGSPDPDLDRDPNTEAPEGEREAPTVSQATDTSLPTNAEVYTETMAEVRINAGQPDKAVAIYEKLSLHYPEKSSYFAQKIADLKSK